MGRPDNDEALIATDIVDAIRDGNPGIQAREVVHVDVARSPRPGPAWIFEVTNKFPLLGIDAQHRQFPTEKRGPLLSDVVELCVPFRHLALDEPLAVDTQRISSLPQQPPDGQRADAESPPAQSSCQLSQRLGCPLQPCDGVPGRCLGKQGIERYEKCRIFYFPRLSTATPYAYTFERLGIHPGQLSSPTQNRRSAQASDRRRRGYAATLCQKARKQPTMSLVKRREEPVDIAVVPRRGSARMSPTSLAVTMMKTY